MDKTFILGVGAQKCGTSWLSSYINQSQQANLGILKEYHCWDAKTLELCEEFKTVDDNLLIQSDQYQIRHKMQNIEGYYERYFAKILEGRINITGDITPSYSMLSSKTFSEIKRRFEDLNINVKVIFLMRDPVDRVISHIKMLAKFKKISDRTGFDKNQSSAANIATKHERAVYNNKLSFEENLVALYQSPLVKQRTLYQETVSELLNVFDSKDCFFQIYEKMFEVDEITRMSEFLGIDVNLKYRETQINAAEKQNYHVNQQTKKMIANTFSETYVFAEQFGFNVKYNWNNYILTR